MTASERDSQVVWDEGPELLNPSRAAFDPARVYRYELTRTWNPNWPPVTWIMLNPSTADADANDAITMRAIVQEGMSHAHAPNTCKIRTWAFSRLTIVRWPNCMRLDSTAPKSHGVSVSSRKRSGALCGDKTLPSGMDARSQWMTRESRRFTRGAPPTIKSPPDSASASTLSVRARGDQESSRGQRPITCVSLSILLRSPGFTQKRAAQKRSADFSEFPNTSSCGYFTMKESARRKSPTFFQPNSMTKLCAFTGTGPPSGESPSLSPSRNVRFGESSSRLVSLSPTAAALMAPSGSQPGETASTGTSVSAVTIPSPVCVLLAATCWNTAWSWRGILAGSSFQAKPSITSTTTGTTTRSAISSYESADMGRVTSFGAPIADQNVWNLHLCISPTTSRRCVSFSRGAWHAGGLRIVNLFAYRATKPAELRRTADPVGPLNDRFILDACARDTVIVAAWGAHGDLGGRAADVTRLLAGSNVRLHRLGTTRGGHPLHPLYVPYSTPLEIHREKS